MHLFTALVLASLVSAEELRFLAVYEQDSEESCGYAAAASLLDLYCGLPLGTEDLRNLLGRPTSASLGELRGLLDAAGIGARSFRIGTAELDEALGRGFAPLLLHYDRPTGHFALLLGKQSGTYVAADPARGLECLSKAELRGRWSGAAILFNPSARGRAGETLRRTSIATALGRRALLAPPGVMAAGEDPHGKTAERERVRLLPAESRTLLLRLDLGLEVESVDLLGDLECGLEWEVGRGCGIGLGLPLEFRLGPELSYLCPGDPAVSCFLHRSLGPTLIGGELGCVLPVGKAFDGETIVASREGSVSIRVDLSRVFDPVALGLSLGMTVPVRMDDRRSRPPMTGASLELGCSAREALNERLYVGASAAMDFRASAVPAGLQKTLVFSGLVGIRLGRFGASLGGLRSSSAALATPIRMGISYMLGAES